MKIGYVRVSKQAQHEVLQIDALKEAGCEKWFVDKITGSKTERKGLDEALAYLQPGDTLVVWKLDRVVCQDCNRVCQDYCRSIRIEKE